MKNELLEQDPTPISTVKELKELIRDLPDEMEIIMSKDTEGNSFTPIWAVSTKRVYIPDSPNSGEVYDLTMSAEDAGFTEGKWEKIKRMDRALVLYP
jgi:hypothetical protein